MMKIEQTVVTINDIANLSVGVNTARINKSLDTAIFYKAGDQMLDLSTPTVKKKTNHLNNKTKHTLHEGDIVINLASHKCSIVCAENANKTLKNTFAKLEIKSPFIDPWFLCYFINEVSLFKNSITPEISFGGVLSVTAIGTSKIYLPELQKQEALGSIYRNLCRIDYLKTTKRELMLKVLEKIQIYS